LILVAKMNRKERERRLGEIVEGRIALNEPLARHSTLGVGGPADVMVFPRSEEELRGVLRFLAGTDTPVFFLGAGADLIVREGGFRGVCVCLARNLTGSKVTGERVVEAMAGETFASLLRLAREASLSGLEFVAAVPGTAGGGVATNVGAFGGSFADRIEKVFLLDREGRERALEREELRVAYRRIELPAGAVVSRVRFRLDPADRDAIEEKIRDCREHRRKTQPLDRPTAGCIFKNPSGTEFAGRLIDRAGLKGLRIGGASVSAVHANFIVNDGDATAGDVLRLMDEVRRRVEEKFDVRLEPEVRVVGEDG